MMPNSSEKKGVAFGIGKLALDRIFRKLSFLTIQCFTYERLNWPRCENGLPSVTHTPETAWGKPRHGLVTVKTSSLCEKQMGLRSYQQQPCSFPS